MAHTPSERALIGNDRLVGYVTANGELVEIGRRTDGEGGYRLRSRFEFHSVPAVGSVQCVAASQPCQQYLEDTFVVEGVCRLPCGIRVRLVDFVPPDHDVFVRHLELHNPTAVTSELLVLHLDAAAAEPVTAGSADRASGTPEPTREEGGFQTAHPDCDSREASLVVGTDPEPDPPPADGGSSFGADNALGDGVCPSPRALRWRITVSPGAQVRIRVILAVGAGTATGRQEAERSLQAAPAVAAPALLNSARGSWRSWTGQSSGMLRRVPESRLRRHARRSLLVLRFLQRDDGAFAPASDQPPDRESLAVPAYMAWMLGRYGYREEANRFFRWWARSELTAAVPTSDEHWPEGDRAGPNETLAGTGTVLWALGEHVSASNASALTRELWPAIQAAAARLHVAVESQAGFCGIILREESAAKLAYTGATVAAGLRAAAELAGRMALPMERAHTLRAAEHVVRAVRDRLARDLQRSGADAWNGENPCLSIPDPRVLGLAVPHRQVHPEWPPFARAAEALICSVQPRCEPRFGRATDRAAPVSSSISTIWVGRTCWRWGRRRRRSATWKQRWNRYPRSVICREPEGRSVRMGSRLVSVAAL